MPDSGDPPAPAILTGLDGPVFTITISNAHRMNALTEAMWRALPAAIAEAESDPKIRVVLLSGNGTRAFSAGADITEFDTARAGEAVLAYDELNGAAFSAVAGCAKPTIARIAGYCMGGGFQLALCCDLRVVAQGAQFAIPAAKLGLGYKPRWLGMIVDAVGTARAKDILFTARHFGHEEAEAFGLVNRLCTLDALNATTNALAAEIAANAPLTIRAAKAAITAYRPCIPPGMGTLEEMALACFSSEDYAEGRAAFREKRTPRFRGR